MKQPIRLTNKTAIALRKNAQRVRTAHFAAAVVLSVCMAALAVYLGVKWLPAVPLTVIACVVLDAMILLRARSRYLMMIGQAICTEASARDIRSESREQKRRERALSDLMEAKADVKKPAAKKLEDTQPFFEKKKADENKATSKEEEDEAPRRRRQQKSLQLIRSNPAK